MSGLRQPACLSRWAERYFRCEGCGQEWHEHLYVLVEFPDDTSFFEEEYIGYPSFGSSDNGARYVSEYDILPILRNNRSRTDISNRLAGRESQLYLFQDESNDDLYSLNEQFKMRAVSRILGRMRYGFHSATSSNDYSEQNSERCRMNGKRAENPSSLFMSCTFGWLVSPCITSCCISLVDAVFPKCFGSELAINDGISPRSRYLSARYR